MFFIVVAVISIYGMIVYNLLLSSNRFCSMFSLIYSWLILENVLILHDFTFSMIFILIVTSTFIWFLSFLVKSRYFIISWLLLIFVLYLSIPSIDTYSIGI